MSYELNAYAEELQQIHGDLEKQETEQESQIKKLKEDLKYSRLFLETLEKVKV